MTRLPCAGPIPIATLLEYWLGELGEAQEARLDEHLLGCGQCSGALEQLVGLGREVRAVVRAGAVHAAVPGAFVDRLSADGLRLRTYRVPHNGSVFCTVAPEDDLLVTRLGAPLAEVEQLDVECVDEGGTRLERLRDVPYDAVAGEVVFTSRMDRVRALPASTVRYRLIDVTPSGERLVGEYTFRHTPYAADDGR